MNWVHLHLALNHIPVLGTLFAGIMFATALIKRSEELKRMSFAWFVVLTIVSIPIKFTGDFAHEAVAESDRLPGPEVAAHEQSAVQATTGMFLLGLVTAFGLYRGRGQRTIPGWVVGATMLLALVTFALMARTANLGGQLRHDEIRSGGFEDHHPDCCFKQLHKHHNRKWPRHAVVDFGLRDPGV